MVVEPPFPYCPSSCYGNLLLAGSLWQIWSISFYLLIPHLPTPTHHTRLRSMNRKFLQPFHRSIAVNPDEFEACLSVSAYVCI